jgi:hypothetical protein
METEDKFRVPYSRRDNGKVKRKAKAITRKGDLYFNSYLIIYNTITILNNFFSLIKFRCQK